MKSLRKATHLRQSKPAESRGEENAAAGQVKTNQQGLSLERKIELEKKRRYSLINKVNRLTASVKEKQEELEGSKKVISIQRSDKNSEETEEQYEEIHQLENSLKRMKAWTEETRRCHTVGKSVSANLNLKSFVLDKELDQKKCQLVDGLLEYDSVKKQCGLAMAAAINRKNQIENEAQQLRREIGVELQKLYARKKAPSEAMGQSERITGNNLAEAASSAPVTPSSMDQQDNISDVQLLENDVEDPTNSLDLHEMELTEEVYLINKDIRQKVNILKELKLHYMILQHSDIAEGKRSHEVTEEERMELSKEVHRVRDLRASLKEPQAQLSTVEQRIDELCFKLHCTTLEELSLSNKDKMRKICIQLNVQKTDTSISNTKKMLQVYNMRDDSFESSEGEGCLTREEIKENSKRLVEAQHKNVTSSWKKQQTM